MRKRSVKSRTVELFKKSREAMLSAVQIYNNPQVVFKSETFITLAVIAWTYLLHAYYRKNNVDYRYYKQNGSRKKYDKTKYGANKYWELERCLTEQKCPLDQDTKNNLRFLIGIRHEIEHQMTSKIDDSLSAKLQACAINYDYYVRQFSDGKINFSKELSIAIQFSAITPNQESQLRDNTRLANNISRFITSFEEALSDEAIKNQRYAYRLLYLPISVNRKGQADSVVEFVKADSSVHGEINRILIKEIEKRKYLPSAVVKQMQEEGYKFFTMKSHTDLWKENDAKNPKKNFGAEVEKKWYWYDSWMTFVRNHCQEKASLYGKE